MTPGVKDNCDNILKEISLPPALKCIFTLISGKLFLQSGRANHLTRCRFYIVKCVLQNVIYARLSSYFAIYTCKVNAGERAHCYISCFWRAIEEKKTEEDKILLMGKILGYHE